MTMVCSGWVIVEERDALGLRLLLVAHQTAKEILTKLGRKHGTQVSLTYSELQDFIQLLDDEAADQGCQDPPPLIPRPAFLPAPPVFDSACARGTQEGGPRQQFELETGGFVPPPETVSDGGHPGDRAPAPGCELGQELFPAVPVGDEVDRPRPIR